MEGLIMMIIIAVISSVLGKGKKTDEPTKQMPPFSNQKVPREWSSRLSTEATTTESKNIRRFCE